MVAHLPGWTQLTTSAISSKGEIPLDVSLDTQTSGVLQMNATRFGVRRDEQYCQLRLKEIELGVWMVDHICSEPHLPKDPDRNMRGVGVGSAMLRLAKEYVGAGVIRSSLTSKESSDLGVYRTEDAEKMWTGLVARKLARHDVDGRYTLL